MPVRTDYAYAGGELLYVQDRYLATMAHTHPIEAPPSPKDLSCLFSDSEHIGAATATWVITGNGSWMALRGRRTPEWSEEERRAKVNDWDRMLERRIRQNLRPGMSKGQVLDINFKAQTAFLRQAAEKYNLQVFVGTKDATELTRLYR